MSATDTIELLNIKFACLYGSYDAWNRIHIFNVKYGSLQSPPSELPPTSKHVSLCVEGIIFLFLFLVVVFFLCFVQSNQTQTFKPIIQPINPSTISQSFTTRDRCNGEQVRQHNRCGYLVRCARIYEHVPRIIDCKINKIQLNILYILLPFALNRCISGALCIYIFRRNNMQHAGEELR